MPEGPSCTGVGLSGGGERWGGGGWGEVGGWNPVHNLWIIYIY